MNKYLTLVALAISLFFYACSESVTGLLNSDSAPKTYIAVFPDSTVSQQQSKVRLHWWGDDKDGLIVGYYISFSPNKWTFTTSNDSTISFVINGLDTTYNFQVAAADNAGNGVYDQHVMYKGIDIGPEPFYSKDSSSTYKTGDKFVDIGNIDPNPATLKLPLKNTPPVVNFLKDKSGNVINIPETTFTAMSFALDASDLDGDETIQKICVALNDTTAKVELPGNTRYITLKGILNGSGNTADCQIYLGSSISTPYSKTVGNLKLNADNVIYIWATDIAGGTSKVIQMPEASSVRKWHVKKPVGDILVINDYANDQAPLAFYRGMMDSLGLLNRTDFYDIGTGKTSSVSGNLMPKIINPMFTETLKLFKYVIWFTDVNPSLDAAQSSVRNYLNAGGKLFASFQFPLYFDPLGLTDFLPIDSISPTSISILAKGMNISPTSQASGYPTLQIDQSTSPVTRVRYYYPNTLVTTNLYTLTSMSNNPIVGFKNNENNLIFIGLPLNRVNGNYKVQDLFRKVLFSEFGVTKK
jgi:hypothetical protein